MPNHKPIDWLTAEDGWTRINLYGREEAEFDEMREEAYQRDIYTDGLGSLIEVQPDGTFDRLVMRMPIPDNAPVPMWGDTERDGVVGYMCQIDFECELGGASCGNSVYPSPSGAFCAGTCGVVEVEVIGRRVILQSSYMDEQPSSGDDEADEAAMKAHIDEMKAALKHFEKTGELPEKIERDTS